MDQRTSLQTLVFLARDILFRRSILHNEYDTYAIKMIFYFLLLVLLPFVNSLLPLELSALCSLPTTLTGFPASWDCVNTNLTTQCTWPGVRCSTNGERVLEMYSLSLN